MNVIGRDGGQSVGSCWGDYDNDGDLDLFVTNSNTLGNFLYRNEGNGDFTKITNSIVVKDKGNSHGCSFADIDNDGDLDLYVTNDKAFKFLYINDGKGEFTSKTDEVINFNFGNAFGKAGVTSIMTVTLIFLLLHILTNQMAFSLIMETIITGLR